MKLVEIEYIACDSIYISSKPGTINAVLGREAKSNGKEQKKNSKTMVE